jgi:hypothetical protein
MKSGFERLNESRLVKLQAFDVKLTRELLFAPEVVVDRPDASA